jgi:hypothetical protein
MGKLISSKRYLYITNGAGLSPNINGLRFYDSGLIQLDRPIYYDETNTYKLRWVAGFWALSRIDNTIGDFVRFNISILGDYTAASGWSGTLTISEYKNNISIKKQNLGGGKLRTYKNLILNSKFDADNQYPIYDGSQFYDNNYDAAGNFNEDPFGAFTILTNYRHNSPLFYNPTLSEYNTFANRTFHEINDPYNTLPIGHPIQPRLLKMFGVGSFFGRRYEYDYGYPNRDDGESNYYRTITNTTSFFPSDSESWVKYGVEQTVQIPSWATKVVYGVKYLAKNDDLFRANNFAGLKLNFRKFAFSRNYVNVHLIRRSTAAAVDTLESLYGSNVYLYFDANSSSNAMCQWLGPNVSKVKVRKRSSNIIDSNTDSFIKIEDTIDIPTFSEEQDYADGRPEEVSLEMFFAEWVNYFVSSGPNGTSSGSIYFYEPFLYFEY